MSVVMGTIRDELPLKIGDFLCKQAQIGEFSSGAAPLGPAWKRALRARTQHGVVTQCGWTAVGSTLFAQSQRSGIEYLLAVYDLIYRHEAFRYEPLRSPSLSQELLAFAITIRQLHRCNIVIKASTCPVRSDHYIVISGPLVV